MPTPVDSTSALVAAAAIALSREIIKEVSNEEFTDMLNGSVVSSGVLSEMVSTSIQNHLGTPRTQAA